MAVCGQLNPVRDPVGNVMHEVVRGRQRAITEAKRQDQLRVRIERRPRPAISATLCLLIGRGVLRLRADERPNFIALHTLR
jgi:hypothetical protein